MMGVDKAVPYAICIMWIGVGIGGGDGGVDGGFGAVCGLDTVVIACSTVQRLRQSQMAAENGQQQAVEGIGQARCAFVVIGRYGAKTGRCRGLSAVKLLAVTQ